MDKLASLAVPLYYRWSFHQSDGTVSLDHNGASHPAYVKTHRHMPSEERSQHGYAYRIHGGWRLTDYEHNPVSNPFIVAQVMQAITGKDRTKQSSDGSWDLIEYDFDRLHYGHPTVK